MIDSASQNKQNNYISTDIPPKGFVESPELLPNDEVNSKNASEA